MRGGSESSSSPHKCLLPLSILLSLLSCAVFEGETDTQAVNVDVSWIFTVKPEQILARK